VVGDALERPRQVGHREPVSRDEALAPALVDPAALLGVAQDDVEDRVQVGLRTRELEALAGEVDRRRDELGPGQAAECAVRCLEAGPEGAEVICIGAPNTGPGDGESVQNWWTD